MLTRAAFIFGGDGEIYELLRARRLGAEIIFQLCARYGEFALQTRGVLHQYSFTNKKRYRESDTVFCWRRWRDLNSRAGYPTYTLSRGASSAS